MKVISFILALICIGTRVGHAQDVGICPTSAVFLGLDSEIRGYSLRSNGPVVPCQIIRGSNTRLGTARALAFSRNAYIHVAQFLTNGSVNIFPPSAADNARPSRTIFVDTNDLVGIAVDSGINDYVASERSQPAEVIFLPNGSSGQQSNPSVFYDNNLVHLGNLAIGRDDNLVVGGYDFNGAVEIDTFGTEQNPSAPAILSTLKGTNTGMIPGSANPFSSNNLSVAVDPESSELYVYNASEDGQNVQISVFAAGAAGDVPPVRVISGPSTSITGSGYLGANKIAVSMDGRLFVAEPNNRILVFAPGANGNVAPSQIIDDLTTTGTFIPQGGIAVRSSQCE